MQTVTTTHIMGVAIQGRQLLTTEAKCPFCGARNAYAHVDSHYSIGRWFGCEHLCAMNYGDDGCIESVEYLET